MTQKKRTEIVASGFGGQGVVRLGQILGEAGVKKGLRVTMLKSHGTEMRGGYVRSQVVLSDEGIDSPNAETPDFLITLSKAAYKQFKHMVPDHGLLLYDPGFVDEIDDTLKCTQKALPARELSNEKFGKPIFANSIVLGALAGQIELLDKDVVLESMLEIIPKFQDLNKKAFNIGYDYL